MRARFPALLAVVLAVTAGLVPVLAGCGEDDDAAVAPELPTIVQDDAQLLHQEPAEIAAALDTLRDLGVDWVRVTAGWSVIAPEPRARRKPEFDATDPAAYPDGAWAALDRVVSMARERDLSVNIDIAFWAPRWAVSRASDEPDRQRYGIDAAAFADFAEAVARRYPDVTAFTIWNEPNFKVFFMPQWREEDGDWVPASPHLYRELLYAAVPRVREHSDATVLIGALAALGSYRPDAEDDGVPPLRFLRELACVDDALRPLERRECEDFQPLPGDGFSHHPYSLDLAPWEADSRPDNVRMADLDRLVDLLRRLHDVGRIRRSLPVFVTEYGYETDPPDPFAPTSTERQADWLPAADRVASETEGVASFAQFLLRDIGPREDAGSRRARWADYQSGLRFPDGRPKPAQRGFRLSLAPKAEADGVSFWVHVRDAAEPRRVRIARRAGDGFTPVGEPFQTDAAGYARRTLAVDPEGEYRLELREDGEWVPAPAVPVRP